MDERRARSDSASAAIDAMQSAAQSLPKPPKHCGLRRRDRVFWRTIVASRARSEWSENDLVIAAQLARCQADIETEQRAMEDESSVIEIRRGPIVNPRLTVLDTLARRQMALMRTLRMGGSALGASRDDEKRRALERTSREIRESLLSEDPDGLLA